MEEIRAVIFDLDGVMVNTEPLAFQAWCEALIPYGVRLDEKDYANMIGLDADHNISYVMQTAGIHLEPAFLKKTLWELLNKILEKELQPMPGVGELLDALARRGLPLAVASNSPSGYVEGCLKAIHVRERFQAVVGREQVVHGKPAPDVYLEAAKQLGVPAQNCLSLEDTVVGMQAAVAAGTACLVVSEDAFREPGFSPAYARFKSLYSVRDELDDLIRRKKVERGQRIFPFAA